MSATAKAAAWVHTVEALWPGARVEPHDRRAPAGSERGGAANDHRRELVFLPDADHPRLLLPAGMPGVAAAALRRYSHDLGIRQRVSRALVAAVARTGVPERAMRDRLRVHGGEGASIEDHLGELLGRTVVVSVGLGTLRANRKPILHVLTPDGTAVAFVKVGDTSTALKLIAAEAVALESLASRDLPGIDVPRVLHHGDWRGLGLLVLSALPTTARGWRPRRSAPLAAMRTLAASGAGWHESKLAGSGYWADIEQVPSRLDDADAASRLTEVIERAGERHGSVALRFGAWHGDWTPWNMSWHRGKLRLWDWERFADGVPYGFDLLHYRLQEATRTAARSPYEQFPSPELLAPLELPRTITTAVTELYFVELCVRYLLAAQEPIGEPLRAHAGQLLNLLHGGGDA
ncbi:phosphotransferase [Actinomadura fulvescens]|uniref:Aminoglycoside phosphotransferase domain-containing protein n=1 Tax=Actinomadura fulvescens TaxID=46160 RepID=A0ABP6C7Z6_9ACTN